MFGWSAKDHSIMAPNTSKSKSEKQDMALVLWRLERVEAAVIEFGSKVDKQENIKRPDLLEIRDTIVTRINEIRDGLQRQIDEKADQSQLDDLKKEVAKK